MVNLGTFTGRYWITIFLWTLVLILVAGREAKGEVGSRGRGVPGVRHVNAQLAAEDCSVVRSVHRRTKQSLSAAKVSLNEQVTIAHQKRAALEACGTSQGLKDTDDQEKILAEVCPDEYASWLATGYRIRVEQEDGDEAREGIQLLELYMDWNCPNLPSIQSASAEMQVPSVQ